MVEETTIGGNFMPGSYPHIKKYEKERAERKEQGFSLRAIRSMCRFINAAKSGYETILSVISPEEVGTFSKTAPSGTQLLTFPSDESA